MYISMHVAKTATRLCKNTPNCLAQGHRFAASSEAWIADALDFLFLGVTKTHVVAFPGVSYKTIVCLHECHFLDDLKRCCGGQEISRTSWPLRRQTLICRKLSS